MRHSRGVLTLVVLAALALTACGGGGGGRLEGAERGGQAMNAQDPATLRDGGDLRLPLDNLPVNFNYLHFDGGEGQTRMVMSALMPRAFDEAPDGGVTMNTHLLESAELVSTQPQVVRYRIHEQAVWSNGRPITWEDFASQVSAMDGSNTAFQFGDKAGYEDIASVERGADDKEVVITFARPYAEWKARLFQFLYPKETTSDPAVFNTGWVERPRITAGPFRVENVDQTAKTITLVRNERWWSTQPRLDRVIFLVTDRAALADRLANNEIDAYEIGSSVDLFQRARAIPGVEIRQAVPKQYSHITFNGAPGAILNDVALRRAIAHGIDRMAIAQRLIGQIVPNVVLMNNHIYPFGSRHYQDNSAGFGFDPAAANRELDALGWVRPADGGPRVKDGRPLRLRFVTPAGNPISDQTSRVVLDQLAAIGVQVVIESVPTSQFFRDFILVGNFDLTSFQWITTGAPFSDSAALYQEPRGDDVGNNYGRIYSPEIARLYAEGVTEFDDARRAEIGNRIDRLVWEQVHHLPLYPQTGAFAVRSTLANWGAKGLGDWNYIPVGFTQ